MVSVAEDVFEEPRETDIDSVDGNSRCAVNHDEFYGCRLWLYFISSLSFVLLCGALIREASDEWADK